MKYSFNLTRNNKNKTTDQVAQDLLTIHMSNVAIPDMTSQFVDHFLSTCQSALNKFWLKCGKGKTDQSGQTGQPIEHRVCHNFSI